MHLAWLAVIAWTALIYATIPFARTLERVFGGLLGGPRAFMALGIGLVLAGLTAAAIRLWRSRAARSTSQYLWLAAVAIAYLGYATRLKVPVEALHFVEYAVLSALVFRALSYRIHDRGIYLCAVLICAIIGTVDELLQWVTPNRFGDLSDVALNLVAATLFQIAIWKGISPSSIEGRFDRRTLRLAAGLACVLVLLLLAWVSATPTRLAELGGLLPPAAAMVENPSVLAEYGHLHTDPEIGSFTSRFSVEELAVLDAAQGPATAAILDDFRDPASYQRFLSEHNAGASPFAHEARVHLYRRNRFLDRLANQPDAGEKRELATVAWREHRIVERFFPTTLDDTSLYQLPPKRRAAVEALADPAATYTSPVGNHLITRFSERQLHGIGFLVLALLAYAFHRLGSIRP